MTSPHDDPYNSAYIKGPVGGGGAGTPGSQILPTTGAPSNATGANGDYALDLAAATMYGPKAAGVWPTGKFLGGTTDTQVFTATGAGSYTPPPGATSFRIKMQQPGGGGGSGGRSGAGVVATGGGSGGAGSYTETVLSAADMALLMSGGVVPFFIGSKGTGGAAQTSDSSAGNAGNAGTQTWLGTANGITANAGGGGPVGRIDSTAQSAAFQGNLLSAAGQVSSTTGAAGVSSGSNSNPGPAGGASGAGITTGNAASAGASGGIAKISGAAAGTAGATNGGNGGNAATPTMHLPGSGGGSGGSSTTQAGGAGGNGSYGAGGGGGGASRNGFASGKGGDGGPSFLEIIATIGPH